MDTENAKKRLRDSIATGIAVVCVVGGSVSAQWLKVPLSGTPRTSDGKPNLTAPTPRTPEGRPNLSGIWQRPDAKYMENLAADGVEVLFQPWAEALYKERQENNGKGQPSERCLPHGVPKAMLPPEPFKIIQTPGVVVILYEEFNHYRQVFTDGRGFPQDPNPTWLGYSVGKWDGDTLVVDTVGFNDQTWLDEGGHPHSDALHVVERFRRRDFGHMEIQITIDDSKAYAKPWTVAMLFDLLPDTELIEHICENLKDATQLVGK